jgi:hypothetical protein
MGVLCLQEIEDAEELAHVRRALLRQFLPPQQEPEGQIDHRDHSVNLEAVNCRPLPRAWTARSPVHLSHLWDLSVQEILVD